MNQALVAVTMGDPAGIGSEITVKLFNDPKLHLEHRAVVIGDAALLERTARTLGLDVLVQRISSVQEAKFESRVLNVLQVGELPGDLPIGQLSARAGRAAYDYVIKAIELAKSNAVQAICTAPINKEAMRLAGISYPGHTEILADFGGAQQFAMMLVNPELRVILVSIHVPLLEAIQTLSVSKELETIRMAHQAMLGLGIAQPRIAVAGLNPHAGEHGLFGSEDETIIAPAIAQARALGIDASGPHAPDTVFMRARRGEYDIVVCQYHDQGLIPIKYLGIDQGVNVTVGLPFVRTSVDHGTAFDIAGRGMADASSLRVALDLARDLCRTRSP
jgi:4-hydroxythreonine-4-phosphate dehydrogenase